jgi:heavy metal sensor kinase
VISRLPLRLRLTLAFAAVMAAVVGGFGAFLYLRLASELDRALDLEVASKLDQLELVAREEAADLGKPGEEELAERGELYDQFLTPVGRPVDASPLVRRVALIDRDGLARLRRGEEVRFDRPAGGGLAERVRVRARKVEAGGRTLLAVAGVSLRQRDDGLASLAVLLLLAGPVAVLLASAAGYGLAAAALRPVEAMRAKAAAIAPGQPGERLPVPPAEDEVRRLAETLNAAIARQEAAFERERRFVSDAGHELRTPLAVLKAELELALRRSRSEEELLAALRSAAEETDRLSQLADDLLVIARSDQGRLPVRSHTLRLDAVLSDAAERFGRRFAAAGRELWVDEPGGLEVEADRLRLDQALGNLLENALRHGAGRVRVWAGRDGGWVHVHVADEGPGFPEGFLPAAFERFTRADAGRSDGGTGLGLAIVDAIARAHGGRVEAGPANGGGAEVRLSLPDAYASSSSTSARSPRVGRPAGSGSRQASTAPASAPGSRREARTDGARSSSWG